MPERVWITGASYGIGRAVALRFARDGVIVAASARTVEKLEALAAEAATLPGRILPLAMDVTKPDEIAQGLDRIEVELGGIDRAILNAGTHEPVDAKDFRTADLRRILELNLFGTANCLEALMPRLMAKRAGQIAVVASVAGYRGLPTAAYYGPGKAALINLVECLKFDLDKAGVDIRLIDPGFVRTPLTDRNEFAMPFLIEPEEAAERIVQGIRGTGFETAFPRRFALIMKLLRLLPYRLYFPLIARSTRK